MIDPYVAVEAVVGEEEQNDRGSAKGIFLALVPTGASSLWVSRW